MSIDGEKNNPLKKRTMNTQWVYLQQPCESILKVSLKWKFIPTGENNTYKIIVGDK